MDLLKKELVGNDRMRTVDNVTDGIIGFVVILLGLWTAGDEEVFRLFLVAVAGMALILLTRRWTVVAWLFRVPFILLFGYFFYAVLFLGATW